MKNKYNLLVSLFIIVSVSFSNCTSDYNKNLSAQKSDNQKHSILFNAESSSKILWEKEFYTITSYFKDIQCVAFENIVIANGRLNATESIQIHAFDGITGLRIWGLDFSGVLEVSNEGLFVGTSQSDVYFINPKNGSIIWQVHLHNAGNINSMLFSNNLIFVNTNGYYQYFVLNKNGKVINQYSQEKLFIADYKSTNFQPLLPFNNALSEGFYIRQFGDVLYSVAVYSNNDTLLWQSESNAISNYLIYNKALIWVSPTDKIIVTDALTGNLIDEYTIAPSMDFFDNNSEKQHAGYYICGNGENQLIYLFLGYSHQIFSINLVE